MKNKKFTSIFLVFALISNMFVFPNVNHADNEKDASLKEKYSV
jgi:hypothetical protein